MTFVCGKIFVSVDIPTCCMLSVLKGKLEKYENFSSCVTTTWINLIHRRVCHII